VLAASQLQPSIWSNKPSVIALPTQSLKAKAVGIVAGALVLGAGIVRLTWRPRLPTIPASFGRSVVLVALAAGMIAGFATEQFYVHHRYTDAPMPKIDRWAQSVHHARIAIVNFSVQYPLYGNDQTDYVQYLATRSADRTSSRIATCSVWRRAVNDGRYAYVVISTPGFPVPPKQPTHELDWPRSAPAARLLLHDSVNGAQAWLFAITGPLDPARCDANTISAAARLPDEATLGTTAMPARNTGDSE